VSSALLILNTAAKCCDLRKLFSVPLRKIPGPRTDGKRGKVDKRSALLFLPHLCSLALLLRIRWRHTSNQGCHHLLDQFKEEEEEEGKWRRRLEPKERDLSHHLMGRRSLKHRNKTKTRRKLSKKRTTTTTIRKGARRGEGSFSGYFGREGTFEPSYLARLVSMVVDRIRWCTRIERK